MDLISFWICFWQFLHSYTIHESCSRRLKIPSVGKTWLKELPLGSSTLDLSLSVSFYILRSSRLLRERLTINCSSKSEGRGAISLKCSIPESQSSSLSHGRNTLINGSSSLDHTSRIQSHIGRTIHRNARTRQKQLINLHFVHVEEVIGHSQVLHCLLQIHFRQFGPYKRLESVIAWPHS